MALIDEAVLAGARKESACDCLDIEIRTLQRWEDDPDKKGDERAGPTLGAANKFSETEVSRIVKIVSSKEFVDLPPTQIIPRLADRGEYAGSESSFYRILHSQNLDAHRGRARVAMERSRPTEFVARNPNEVWSWDITYMKSNIRGQYFYLYLFLDIFSRQIVGWGVYEIESMEISSSLFKDICRQNKVEQTGIVLHADNGGPMKGATMLSTLQKLGVVKSFSRASVSDDNPFSESLFRTMKYRPGYPTKPFASVEAARSWVEGFVRWYNTEHLHSEISFTTPASRHNGDDVLILKKRDGVYKMARAENPLRWSGATRDWSRVETVTLNPTTRESKPSRSEEKKAA
jgi:transposase InsO family protein